MATIKQIAELANVSPATVSRVLNQDESLVVTPEVRNQIFRIAHELKYVPPKMRYSGKKAKQIVIGVADWHIVRKDREDVRLEMLDYNAGIISPKVEVTFERVLYGEDKKVDGMIAFGSFSEEEMHFLRRQSYAILFVNANQSDYEFDQIIMDYTQGLKDMVRYLMEEKEYRSIGYIGGIYEDDTVRIGMNRMNTLKEILENRGCYEEKNFCIGEISRESGYTLTKERLLAGDVPEVLILGNDEVAEGALAAIKEQNYRIPKDVAVVIYQDIETLEAKGASYTSLRMLPEIVWTTATKLLLERIVEGRKDTMKIYLPTRLEMGDSA